MGETHHFPAKPRSFSPRSAIPTRRLTPASFTFVPKPAPRTHPQTRTHTKPLPSPPHPYSLSVPNPPKPKARPLTTTPTHTPDETDAQRSARHLRICRRLAELGMQLAEATAETILAEPNLAPPNLAPSNPAPSGNAPPGNAPETPTQPEATHLSRHAHAVLAFTRLALSVRQTIALETRLAATRKAQSGALPTADDPRRAPVREALCRATAGRPDSAVLRLATDAKLDYELAADPHATIPEAELVALLKATFELDTPKPRPATPKPATPHPATTQSKQLDPPPEDHPWPWPPHPRATSPPVPA